MLILIYALILLFGMSSYIIGIRAMLLNRYEPSIFSRVVWLLLAIISFASVVASHSSASSVLLSGIFLLGNASICIASFWKGSASFGRLEYFCLTILVISGCVTFLFNAPLVGLAVSLFAHFVGGVPTFRKVWMNPGSESTGFWSLFFIASMLSLVLDWGQPVVMLLFPLYFVLFDGLMTVLSLRMSRDKVSI